MPEPEVVEFLLKPLNTAGIGYMVTGGLAAIVYGEPRLTNDVDLVVDIGPSDANRLFAMFDPSVYYVPPIEVMREQAALAAHGHFNILHRDRALRADVYVAGQDPLARWAFERRVKVPLEDEPVWVAPIEYVIVMKLEYFRQSKSDRHLRDIAAILRHSGQHVDQAALSSWITRLGLEHEWDLARDHDRR